MHITVNAKPMELPENTTVRALIEHLDLATATCAAEVNKQLVPHQKHETHTLKDGDTIEIVTLVGGG